MYAGTRPQVFDGHACRHDDLLAALPLRHIVLEDFEFHPDDNLNPVPICHVARELRSGAVVRHWKNADHSDTLVVAHAATAEVGCYLALNWQMPAHVFDTYAEFRSLTNTAISKHDARRQSASLLAALQHFGLESITASEKDEWRELILTKALGHTNRRQASWPTARATW